MKLGFAIRLTRKKLGVTQLNLAKQCKLSQTSLSLIESDKKQPSPKTIEKICAELEIPALVLYVIAMPASYIPASKNEAFTVLYPIMKSLTMQLFDARCMHLFEEEQLVAT